METSRAPGPISHARLDWTDGAPRSEQFGDVYFSGDGLAETRHVFLEANALPERFGSARRFAIGELGFGSGLNFLMTADLWRRARPTSARLVYLSIEKHPLAPADMVRAHAAWPALERDAARLRALLPPAVAGLHSLPFAEDVTLLLAYGEALSALESLEGEFDTWFFDGFAPSRNPEMWRPEIFAEAARLSAPHARFATFTVAGAVRQGLIDAGFVVEKRPGYGRKREMLAGSLARPSTAQSRRAPWFRAAHVASLPTGARIAVIGAGIAGASIAFAARRAGLSPTLFDADGPAAGASGNPAGLIMPRLDIGATAAARFQLSAYLHTIRLLSDGSDSPFDACGVVLGAADAEERTRQAKLLAAPPLPADWMEASPAGLHFPQAGVVDPPAYVRRLAEGAEFRRLRVKGLLPRPDALELATDAGPSEAFDAIVLACGPDCGRFLEARGIPFSRTAGQIDLFPDARAPRPAFAAGPYAAPAPAGGLVIGATFDRLGPEERATPSAMAMRRNIDALAALAPHLAEGLVGQAAISRASVRCQTPDRNPAAGALPDLGYYAGAYDGLRTGRRGDYPAGESVRGAFILSGLGARGLVTAPLAAEFVIAEMTGAPRPLDHGVAEALHPARFFIRDLRRAVTVRRP